MYVQKVEFPNCKAKAFELHLEKGVNRAKIRFGSFPNRHNLDFKRKQT